jgi:hypothetical protein
MNRLLPSTAPAVYLGNTDFLGRIPPIEPMTRR